MLTNEEKEFLILAMNQMNEYYDDLANTCRRFKWICHKHLPQQGEEYVKNKNVFEIQDKTLEDIRKQKKDCQNVFLKLINQQDKIKKGVDYLATLEEKQDAQMSNTLKKIVKKRKQK